MVSFTGSLQAGRCTASVAGDGIKKVCLELGGKSAFVVLDDALFDQAIAAGVNNANDSRDRTARAGRILSVEIDSALTSLQS